ncbi:MAG: HYR domain-containing protein [Saprospiraceae bacterium]|nr:HYR domain-containing protein [Saprospiraceae bacterium]
MKKRITANREMANPRIVVLVFLWFFSSIQIIFAQCEGCLEPEAYIASACSCRDNSPNSEGNATNLQNGQFTETIVVQSDPDESWMILQNTGFYKPSSPQPPAQPIPFLTGTIMIEADPGFYVLKGVHVDQLGYTLLLSNGQDTLEVSNLCAYPNPVATELASGYCESSEVQLLLGNGGGASGSGVFDILDPGDMSLLVPNATVFDPAGLGIGNYLIRYAFNQEPDIAPCTYCEPGCIQAISQEVEVASLPLSMDCNDLIQISLDEDCMQLLDPDLILEGSYPSYSIFEVHIFNGPNDLGDVVNSTMIGQILEVQVTNTCDDNSCWAHINVLDKWKPVFDCPQIPIQISCLADPDDILPPTAMDNCDLNIIPILGSEFIENFDCTGEDGLLQRITRKWQAVDQSGNQATPCLQILEVSVPEIGLVQFPPDLDGPTALDCTGDEPGPAISGYPTLDGYPLLEGENLCQLYASYEDVILEGCGSSYKILRKWTVQNWCQTEEVVSQNQLIHLADLLPPVLNCPDSISVSINGPGCLASFVFPEIDASDACSPFEITVQGFGGQIIYPGAFLEEVEAGIYDLNIQAIDECGNTASCSFDLQVVDSSAPIAICDEFTTVALDVAGVAEILAASLDDGSYDFCTEVYFAGRRMDEQVDFTPSISFGCADLQNNPILVQIQVSDAFGHANTCMVEVEVEDKLAPQITCPENQVVDCDTPLSDLEIFGLPSVMEACDYALTFNYSEDLNVCNIGLLNLTYTATDSSGNQSSCSFSVEVEDPLPFGESMILWPEDFEASSCDSLLQLSPDSLADSPINYSYPQFLDHECSLLGISYEDAFFDLSEPACFKIVRTWSVIDWCQFDPVTESGIWTYEQVLNITDNEAPIVFCAFSTFIKITGPVCYETVNLDFPIVTDCSPEIDVQVSSDLGEGFGPFPNVPVGQYDVEYAITDQCGNATYCTFVLNVVDAKNPTPVCMNGLVVEMSPDGMVDVNVSVFNLGSYDNCTAPEDLMLSFSGFFNDTIRTFTCDDLGPQTLEMWVFDEAYNYDKCVFDIYVQDNLGHCSSGDLTIAGQITTEMNAPVALVEIDINNGFQPAVTNGPDGLYGFYNLQAGDDYTVTPVKDINFQNGVSTYDILLISLHILGIQPLDSPYKLIAADVNGSGSISTIDALELRKLILGEINSFYNNDSWRFVKAAYEFPNPQNPFQPPFPEVISYNNLTEDQLDADFIGVKIGDVDNSANPLNFGEPENRNIGESVFWHISDQALSEGTPFTVEIQMDDPSFSGSWLQTLAWDPNVLEFLGVDIADPALAAFQLDAGQLNLAGIQLDAAPKRVLYSLHFKSQISGPLEGLLWLSPKGESEFRNRSGAYLPLQLLFDAGVSDQINLYPNPGRGDAFLSFNLEQAAEISLLLRDVGGRVIWDDHSWQDAGSKHLLIPMSDIGAGLYFLEVRRAGKMQTLRIIRHE